MKTICNLTAASRKLRMPFATLAVALFITALAPGVAAAQSSTGLDPSWTAWLGCWEIIQDDTRAASTLVPGAAAATARRQTRQPGGDMRVCVTPAGSDAGVKMTTWAADRVVLEQRILADGSQQLLDEADCRGWQRSEWSQTRTQLFTRAELECKDQPRRSVSGVTLIADGPTWLDIQALEVDGDQVLRVRRYQRAADQSSLELSPDLAARASSEAQRLAAARLGLDDVIQAGSKIPSKAVEAMLVETRSTFNLDSRALIRLQKAGVAADVTDLMVALSFPERFVIERQAGLGGSTGFYSSSSSLYSAASPYAPYSPYGYSNYGYSPYGYSNYGYSPYGYSPYGYSPYGYSSYGYSPYGYTYSPYAYSPFAYLYWSSPYRGGSSVRLISPGGAVSTMTGEARTGTGRVIAGQGYTRVRPRGDAGGTAQAGQGTSSSTGGGGSSGVRGSSGGGTVSRGGYSSGSGSRSGSGSSGGGSSSGGSSSGGGSRSGRTAQPR